MRSLVQRLIQSKPPHTLSRSSYYKTIRMSSATSTILYAASLSTPTAKGAVPDDPTTTNKSHHVKAGGFENPWDSWQTMSSPQIIVALIKRRWHGTSNKPDTTPPTVPIRKPKFLPSRETKTLRATWLGHACYYVEFPGGLRVLFDPVFTDRCSPFSWLGPKRYTEMPCQIEDIPTIDAVVISHNHYDHLSHPTISKIAQLHPNCHFFAPLGNKKWFTDCGVTKMSELDWWEELDLTLNPSSNVAKPERTPSTISATPTDPFKDDSTPSSTMTATFSSLPCQHISARTPFDRSKTLWSSWSVTSGGKSVWFGGDTGYRAVPEHLPKGVTSDWDPSLNLPHCPAFTQIGKYRGPFDLGLIPIGAYDPRFIMSPMHADPRDAVEIFRDTKCKRAMGIHWGTWVLTEEDVLEPPVRLSAALKERGIEETGVFDVCDIGESREF